MIVGTFLLTCLLLQYMCLKRYVNILQCTVAHNNSTTCNFEHDFWAIFLVFEVWSSTLILSIWQWHFIPLLLNSGNGYTYCVTDFMVFRMGTISFTLTWNNWHKCWSSYLEHSAVQFSELDAVMTGQWIACSWTIDLWAGIEIPFQITIQVQNLWGSVWWERLFHLKKKKKKEW